MEFEIERMEINDTFYFFEKVIKKLLIFCYRWKKFIFTVR